ncbi:MAG: hypothetical protein RL685_5708 [Pseudomonadota bacterium]|jgi:hypothetical protein
MGDETELRYLQILIEPIRVCASYRPKMGKGAAGLNLEAFQALYRADPFYAWYGLDHPLMYAAHKAAGGMTSIYRQVGIGAERLFRQLLQDYLGLSIIQSSWSYEVNSLSGTPRTLYLDARIELADVVDDTKRRRVREWMNAAADDLGVAPQIRDSLKGIVFEVRQGYKSKDSKRQNADIANAGTAYAQAFLPCLVVLSAQIDSDVLIRYRAGGWTILTGTVADASPLRSTYAFMRDVIGFDLEQFFVRSSATLRTEVESVLQALLAAK